jgi:hypothetical protein
MPSLAHILAPQIKKKAEEIEAATSVGYLGARRPGTWHTAGGQRKNVEALAAPDAAPVAPPQAPPSASYLRAGNTSGPAPTASEATLKQLREEEKKRTVIGTVRSKALQAAKQADLDAKHLQFPVVPAAPPVEVSKKTDKRGRAMIPMGPGAVAVNERGESLDARGKNLGYLQSGPARTGAMTPADVHQNMEQALRYGNQDAPRLLHQLYGEHLKEMLENRDAQGMPTDKFPAGYFKGMSPEQKKNIIEGVRLLREIDRPVSI